MTRYIKNLVTIVWIKKRKCQLPKLKLLLGNEIGIAIYRFEVLRSLRIMNDSCNSFIVVYEV